MAPACSQIPFSAGASCVLFPGRCTPEALFERIARHRPTVLINVPTMIQQMLAHDANYAGTHYALALVAERNEDLKTAREAFARAVKAWSMADADLPELSESRKKLR